MQGCWKMEMAAGALTLCALQTPGTNHGYWHGTQEQHRTHRKHTGPASNKDEILRAERARYLRGCKRSDPQYKYRSARKARTINYRDPMVQSTCMPSFGAQHLHARVSAERSANKNIDLRCRAHIYIRADDAKSPCWARATNRPTEAAFRAPA